MFVLFMYDHLMDPIEFMRYYPTIKVKSLGIARLNGYKLHWGLKGIPFVCRKRPYITPLSGSHVYGVIFQLKTGDLEEFLDFTKSNFMNEVLNITIDIVKIYDDGNIEFKDLNISQTTLRSGMNYESKQIKAMTITANVSNMLLDKVFIDNLLKKGGVDILKSKYFSSLRNEGTQVNYTYPSDDYIRNLTNISKKLGFPEEYIKNSIDISPTQALSFWQRILKKIFCKFIHLFSLLKLQDIAYGLLDLLWEIDPNDALVHGDYGNINIYLKIFIIVCFMFFLTLPGLITYAFYAWLRFW
ncbi:hypothetical protein cand_033300 [Cryptosporidium andersoni]|uniref:Uncharacterized protein n=1 Tax=Cryptosporidium andersoni TaxID=117008 RepID=A0A1J4MBL9_9CRYT|nr:hypothetical protein cand_033300 [Cryptosporidium andersoni]